MCYIIEHYCSRVSFLSIQNVLNYLIEIKFENRKKLKKF